MLHHKSGVKFKEALRRFDEYKENRIHWTIVWHYRETMTKEEIYNLLNIKLRRSDIAEFVFHRKFEKFIYSKS